MNRHALVTGASSGIGRAIVERLLREGWQVTGLSRSAAGASHPALRMIAVDLFDGQALAVVLDALPPVDAFVHAAGMMQAATLGALDSEISQRLWHLHVQVAETIANRLASTLPVNGRIILIGSRTSRGATATPMLDGPGRESSPPKLPPIGRYIQPEEVAALTSFLLSPAAAAITGQEIAICGGASLS